jgi:hypothetical protein
MPRDNPPFSRYIPPPSSPAALASYGPELDALLSSWQDDEKAQRAAATAKADKAKAAAIEAAHRAKLPPEWVPILDDSGDRVLEYLNTVTGLTSDNHPGVRAALREAEKKHAAVVASEDKRIAAWRAEREARARGLQAAVNGAMAQTWATRVRRVEDEDEYDDGNAAGGGEWRKDEDEDAEGDDEEGQRPSARDRADAKVSGALEMADLLLVALESGGAGM